MSTRTTPRPAEPRNLPTKGQSGRHRSALAPVATVPSPVSGTTSLDKDLAARAYRKVMDKQELTAAERAALKRHEKAAEERLRWKHYVSIPQKHWRQMSGRQTKVLNEQALRYGLPLGGPVINLPDLARSLHDFLAENALKLARDEDALLSGPASP